jgi:hypothetical protein
VPARVPGIYVFGPDGFQSPIEVKRLAEGLYRGRLRIGDRQGLFRVRPVEESRVFPEIGLYRPEEEMTSFGNNESLLKQLASYTGGRFNPEPGQVFDPAGRSIAGRLRLWPFFLGLAVLLNLAELAWRKIGERLPWMRLLSGLRA